MIGSRARHGRILIGPREIAGVATGLQHVLTGQGFEVDVFLRWSHPFGYRHHGSRSGLLRLLARTAIEPHDSPTGRGRRLTSLVARVALVPLIRYRYGAVVYLGPDTLLRGGRDRRWLTRSGVRTVTVFLGSEARPPYLDGAFAHGSTPAELDAVRSLAIATRARVRRAESDSTYVVNHPGTGQFHWRPFVDWTALGYPTPDVSAAETGQSPRGEHARPVLLHAPSDVLMKGTDGIREAVAELEQEGLDFEYVELSGRPHADVLAAVRASDLVVDQLYSDSLLPGLATEAARLGTPVVVFGYASELLGPLGERAGVPTAHYAHPGQVTAVLRHLLSDPSARAALAADLASCVRGTWSTREQGRRWATVVTGRPEPSWLNQPDTTPYAHGCAIEEGKLVRFLENYLGALGDEALCLEDSPNTRAAVVRLAGFEGRRAFSGGR